MAEKSNLNTVDDWLAYIQTLHFRSMDLGLERVAKVYQMLYPKQPFKAILVAGTNGKGSSSEMLSSIYTEAGFTVAKFSSPHIVRFNERFQVNGANCSDKELIAALEEVEATRGSVSLTYFEFCALAAIVLFANRQVDLAVMEVGLGGRLDAVNILDPVVSLITSISLDHTQWLGETREQIVVEKLGISRSYVPLVLAFEDLPVGTMEYCQQRDIPSDCLGRDFLYEYDAKARNWNWVWAAGKRIDRLPLAFNQAGVQLQNLAGALMCVELLQSQFAVSRNAIAAGLNNATIFARAQLVGDSPAIIIDVAHNYDAVAALRDRIDGLRIEGRHYAICGMLADKDIHSCIELLVGKIDEWHFASIDDERGSSAEDLKAIAAKLDIKNQQVRFHAHNNAARAFKQLVPTLEQQDALIIFGSFFVIANIYSDLQAYLQKISN